jgi:hypothetical protein
MHLLSEKRRGDASPLSCPESQPLSSVDVMLMVAGFALPLVIAYVFGRHRLLWEDEVLGWKLVSDPSWRHMVYARNLGADGGGFSFYVTCRLWFNLVGASALTFRLYSAICIGLAFCVTWTVVRRFYSTGITAFALFNTWFLCPLIVIHMAEGRFYGLMLLGTALVLWITVKLASDRGPAKAYSYVLLFVLNGFLVTTHLLGIVYSGSYLLALILLDRLSYRWRPLLYLSAASSWLLLIADRTAIRAAAAAGKPWFWVAPPTVKQFLAAYIAFSREMAAVLLVLFLGVAWRCWQRRGYRTDLREALQARPEVYVIVFVLLIVPVEFVVASKVGTPIFLNRYLLPVSIAQMFLLAEALQLLGLQDLMARITHGSRRGMVWIQITASVCFGVVLLCGVFLYIQKGALGLSDDANAVTARMPSDEPVVCEDGIAFLAMMGPNPPKVQCTYVLDWQHSVSKDAPRGEVSEYHLLESWKRANYAPGHIRYLDEFLKDEPQFLVLHDVVKPVPGVMPVVGNPLVERFSQSPQYQVEMYSRGVVTKDEPERDLWLVCRGLCKGKTSP